VLVFVEKCVPTCEEICVLHVEKDVYLYVKKDVSSHVGIRDREICG